MIVLLKTVSRRTAFVGFGLVCGLLLGACAGPPTLPAMQAVVPAATVATAPGRVVVSVMGGQQSSVLEGPLVSDADFKAAVEASLLNARAFEGVADAAAARYALNATIVRLARPMWGGTMTVDLEVGWSLVDRRRDQTGEKVSDKLLLRKVINASGSATMSETLVGATRVRLAVEAAVRANIEQLLRELAAVVY